MISIILENKYCNTYYIYCIPSLETFQLSMSIGIRSVKGRQLHFKASVWKQTCKETWRFRKKNKRFLVHSRESFMVYIVN